MARICGPSVVSVLSVVGQLLRADSEQDFGSSAIIVAVNLCH
jgi:hypothetical protein